MAAADDDHVEVSHGPQGYLSLRLAQGRRWPGCSERPPCSATSHRCSRSAAFWPTNLLLTNAAIRHRQPAILLSILVGYTQNTEGLRLVHSTATLINSLVLGGDHAPWPASFSPKPAVTLNNSTMMLGPGATIVGGTASGSGNAASYVTVGTAPTAVYRDFRAYIHWPFSLAPPPVPQDLHATLHDVVDANAAFDLVVAGPPGVPHGHVFALQSAVLARTARGR